MREQITIHNKPDYADDYEFVVARKCDDGFGFGELMKMVLELIKPHQKLVEWFSTM